MLRLNKFIKLIKTWKLEFDQYNNLEKLFKSAIKNNKFRNKTIVFNIVRNNRKYFDNEAYIAKLLALNGANVKILLDDGILSHWDTYHIDNFKRNLKVKDLNKYSLNPAYKYRNIHNGIWFLAREFINKVLMKKNFNIYKDENLEIIFYSRIFKQDLFKNFNLFPSINDLNKFAESSTIRFFKTPFLEYNNPIIKKFFILSKRNAIISKLIGEYSNKILNSDIFITSHGIYSTWGPAFEYLKRKKIKSYVIVPRFSHGKKEKIGLLVDTKMQTLSKSESWKKFSHKKVTKDMRKKVENYFQLRTNFQIEDTRVLFKNPEDFKIYKSKDFDYYVGMFPNVIWDGNIKDRKNIFKTRLDWFKTTIDFFKKNKNLRLYIKSHPSEVTVLKNSPRISDILQNYYDFSKITNISLIPPNSRINTYNFIKQLDLGIVYDGTLGIEMPYLGIPTILSVKDGFSTIEGGNFTPKNKSEYLNYLNNIDHLINKFHANYEKYYLDNIIRYIYWYLYENKIKIPTLRNKKNQMKGFQLRKEDLKLEKRLLEILN